MILIISAMDCEIDEFKKNMIIKQEGKFHFPYYIGTLFEKEIILSEVGIGKVMSSLNTQYLIDNYKIDRIIFSGIAGSINPNLNIGDLVVAIKSIQYDLDVRPFHKLGTQPDTKISYIESDTALNELALSFDPKNHSEFKDNKVIEGIIGTGDIFVKDKSANPNIKELNCDCVEMEGGAVAFVAYINKIPFTLIRVISDKADGSAEEDFYNFVHKASALTFQCISHILDKI